MHERKPKAQLKRRLRRTLKSKALANHLRRDTGCWRSMAPRPLLKKSMRTGERCSETSRKISDDRERRSKS